jgi:hypothetical protein
MGMLFLRSFSIPKGRCSDFLFGFKALPPTPAPRSIPLPKFSAFELFGQQFAHLQTVSQGFLVKFRIEAGEFSLQGE